LEATGGGLSHAALGDSRRYKGTALARLSHRGVWYLRKVGEELNKVGVRDYLIYFASCFFGRMTVIKGELNDPNSGRVSVSPDFETAVVGDLDRYCDDLKYVEVDGLKIESPVEIDFLDSSVNFRRVPVGSISRYRYSGRDYSPDFFDDIIMEDESMRRAPSVVGSGNGYEVVDGNSYFEAYRKKRNEDYIWVRIHDYSSEESLDHFLQDHFPCSRAELESGSWYSDEEIDRTLSNLSGDLGTEISLSELEESERLGFNVDRIGW
jgi:hypothetical protein